MPCDVFKLLAPAALVHAKRLVTAVAWQLVEPRLDDAQQRPRRGFLQGELDERRRLSGIIFVGIDGIRMPGEREQSLRLHFLNDRLPAQVLVTRIGDLSARNLSRHKWVFEPDSKPRAELVMVGQRTPDARDRRLELDGFLDAIAHAQPTGCPLPYTGPRRCATVLLRFAANDVKARRMG